MDCATFTKTLLNPPFPVRLAGGGLGGEGQQAQGRGLYAQAHIAAGTVALRSVSAGATLHRKHAGYICASCLAFSEDVDEPLEVSCPACPWVSYCSEACRGLAAPAHRLACETHAAPAGDVARASGGIFSAHKLRGSLLLLAPAQP